MASGDTIFDGLAHDSQPVSANAATPDWVADASTPNILTPVMRYDGAANEHRDYIFQIPSHYGGGGFTWRHKYAQDGASGNACVFEIRMLVIDDLEDLNADLGLDLQTASQISDTPSTTTNEFNYSGSGTLSHANADSPAVRDWAVVRLTRDAVDAGDSNTNDMMHAGIVIEET